MGWIFIVAGGLVTPVSLIAALMILAGGHGSSGGSFFGGLTVIGAPPATLVAGIGLLRRWRWSYGYAIALLVVIAGYNLQQIVGGATPEVRTVSPSGVITTQLAWTPNYPLHIVIVVISVGLLIALLRPEIRTLFRRHRRGD